MEDYSTHPLYKKHTLDSAMDSLWQFYSGHFLALFLISFVASIATNFYMQTIDFSQFVNASEMIKTDPDSLSQYILALKKIFTMMIPIFLLTIFTNVVISLYTLRNPAEGNNIVSFILGSFRFFPTYLIVLILAVPLAFIAFAAGILALIVGVLFSMIWIIALMMFVLPFLMAEGNDITNCITGSFRLMHKNFWPNMGWTAILVVLVLIMSFILSGLAMIPFAGSFLQTIANPDEPAHILELTSNPVYTLMSAALSSLITPLLPIFSFILYFNGKSREATISAI